MRCFCYTNLKYPPWGTKDLWLDIIRIRIRIEGLLPASKDNIRGAGQVHVPVDFGVICIRLHDFCQVHAGGFLHGFKELCHDYRHVAGNGPYAVILIIAASDNRNLVNL